jgi:hypothetical protein
VSALASGKLRTPHKNARYRGHNRPVPLQYPCIDSPSPKEVAGTPPSKYRRTRACSCDRDVSTSLPTQTARGND